MKKQPWRAYTFWIILSELVGAISGWLTREGTQIFSDTVTKPPLSPPSIVFPIVWSILFALMGIGAARVYLTPASDERSFALQIFLAQLGFNFFWSIIFFNFQNYALAFFWLLALWGLILWTILSFRKVDKPAALLQLPYLLWTTFAGYLSLGVWLLND